MVKVFFRRIVRRIPLSLIAAVIGLIAGTAIWQVVDRLQKEKINQLYLEQLQVNLEQRSREALVHFESSLTGYKTAARLLANHRKMLLYLKRKYWFSDEPQEIKNYTRQLPPWLPDPTDWQPLISPSHIILLDNQGKIRERYQARMQTLPESLLHEISDYVSTSKPRLFLKSYAGRPWLLASTQALDINNSLTGSLLLLVPIDRIFLQLVQPGIDHNQMSMAMVDIETNRILATSSSKSSDTPLVMDDLRDDHALSNLTFPEELANKQLGFLSYISKHSMQSITKKVQRMERRQRTAMALYLIAFFTLLLMLVSNRIGATLRRLSRLSQKALGISQPTGRFGNQLVILDDWIRQFILLIREAREKLSKQHKYEIAQHEALTETILETSLDSIITVNASGAIVDFNATAEDIFGYSASEIVGKNASEILIHDAYRQAFMQMLHESEMGHDQEVHSELIAINRESQKFPVEIGIRSIYFNNERLFTLYLRDITERKLQEAEIHSLAAFPEESPIPVMRISQSFSVTYANSASAPLLEDLKISQSQKMPLNWIGRIEQVLDNKKPEDYEWNAGQRIWSILLAPVADSDYVNLYGRDITEIRKAEKVARQHQDELVHVSRLSSMGEMATGLAHELNQPLGAIINYTNGARRRISQGATIADLELPLQQINSQAGRAAEIIKRLREMVEHQVSTQELADISYMVKEVLKFLDHELRKAQIVVQTDFASDTAQVKVDIIQLEQVILNVITNAIDALVEHQIALPVIAIRSSNWQDKVKIRIEDNGNGIADDQVTQLFEQFYTTKMTGMGMGLAIGRTIIESHEGTISYYKSSLGGAGFQILLPSADHLEVA